MDRNELLRDQIRENKDPQTILVSTRHPKLSAIPSILKTNFHLISSDPKLSKFQTETYCHLPKKQIPFRSPFEKRYCKSAISFQRSNLWKMQTLPANKYSQTHHQRQIKHNGKNKRYWKLQGKGNNLRCTMFQAQGLIYWTYRGTTFRAFLQTSLRHQKQARQQRTCKTFSRKS